MKILALAVLVLVPWMAAPAQDSLTVHDVLRQVMANNPAMRQAEYGVEASRSRVSQSEAAYLPVIDVDASYVRIGPVPSIGFGGLVFKLFPENNYDGHVAGRYTLYDFGRRKAELDLTSSLERIAADGVGISRENLSYQSMRLFYTVLFLQESEKVQDEEIQTLGQHLNAAQDRERAGSATSFDVLTTRVRVAEAQQRWTGIENALEKQRSALRQLMGTPLGTPLLLSGTFDAGTTLAPFDSLIALAERQRPDLQMAQDAAVAANLRVRARTTEDLPALRLLASYGVKNGYIPNLDVLRGNWTVGVQAQLPLLDGGRTKHQVEEAEWNLRAADEHKREVDLQVRAEIEQSLADLDAARASMGISRLQVAQAQEAFDLAQRRYDSGSSTNLDLLDAATRLAQAKLGYLQARYMYMLGTIELGHATGGTTSD